jgi:AhpD family alkylhydroperoxidase
MAPGKWNALTKELIYVAMSVTNGGRFGINSHSTAARGKGMRDAMLAELPAVVGMANQINALVSGFQIEVNAPFRNGSRATT